MYSEIVKRRVRQRLDLEEFDLSKDGEIDQMSSDSVFNHCLEWEGLLGFDSLIKEFVESIYQVRLNRR